MSYLWLFHLVLFTDPLLPGFLHICALSTTVCHNFLLGNLHRLTQSILYLKISSRSRYTYPLYHHHHCHHHRLTKILERRIREIKWWDQEVLQRKVSNLTLPISQNHFETCIVAGSHIEMVPLPLQFEEASSTTSISTGIDHFLFAILTVSPKFTF